MANKSISKEEQENIKELFLKFQETRDKKTRDTLVEKNLYIAEILAKKYTGRGIAVSYTHLTLPTICSV